MHAGEGVPGRRRLIVQREQVHTTSMSRRLHVVAAIVLGGLSCAVVLFLASDPCMEQAFARGLAQHGKGPAVSLSIACVPSYLAREFGVEVAFIAGAMAMAAALVALVVLVARLLLGPVRTSHARLVVGWINVGALALMMVALAAVAGSGEGELRAFALAPLVVGVAVSLIGSFTGARFVPPASAPNART